MTVTVKLFALGRELIGHSELPIDLPAAASVQSLLELLRSRYPQFGRLPSFLIAVNMEYADSDAILADGDEVAIIPPVSGG